MCGLSLSLWQVLRNLLRCFGYLGLTAANTPQVPHSPHGTMAITDWRVIGKFPGSFEVLVGPNNAFLRPPLLFFACSVCKVLKRAPSWVTTVPLRSCLLSLINIAPPPFPRLASASLLAFFFSLSSRPSVSSSSLSRFLIIIGFCEIFKSSVWTSRLLGPPPFRGFLASLPFGAHVKVFFLSSPPAFGLSPLPDAIPPICFVLRPTPSCVTPDPLRSFFSHRDVDFTPPVLPSCPPIGLASYWLHCVSCQISFMHQ